MRARDKKRPATIYPKGELKLRPEVQVNASDFKQMLVWQAAADEELSKRPPNTTNPPPSAEDYKKALFPHGSLE